MRLIFCIWATMVALPCVADAAPIEEALARIYESNPRLEAARARLRAVDEGVPRARSGGRPTLTSQSTAGIARQDTSKGSGTLAVGRQTIALKQSIYNGGETRALVSAAEEAVMAERARLAAVEQDVLLEGIAAYTALLRDQVVLRLAQENEERHRKQVLGTRDRFRFGQVTRTDVAQAEGRHARSVDDRISAEGEYETSIADYLRLVGEQPGITSAVPKPRGLPASLDAALAMVDLHPAVTAAGHDLDAARDEIDAAQAQLRPRLALEGQLGYAHDPSAELSRQSDASLAATLTVPLYQGGGEYAKLRQTKQSAQQRRYDMDDVRRAVARDIAASWRALQTATSRIRTLDIQVRAADIAYDGVRQETLGGTRTVLELLDAEEERFKARVERERAYREEIVTGYAVLAATGNLSAASLELAVSPYDPARHYQAVESSWTGTGPKAPGRAAGAPGKR